MDENCSICLGAINTEFFITICGHVFHNNCISTWLKRGNTCPVCRKKLKKSGDMQVSNDELIDFLEENTIYITAYSTRIVIINGSIETRTTELSGTELYSTLEDIRSNLSSVDIDRLLRWLTVRDIVR